MNKEVNGKRDGCWEWYYSNGELQCKGNYKDGKRDGCWEWFNTDGTQEIQVFYF